MIETYDCLAILNEAMGRRIPDPHHRVLAAADAQSPDEGLALLGAYVSIADRRVRQAVLDLLQMIATVDGEVETPA